MPCEPLPIDSVLSELIEKLKSAGSVVLRARPGAGKTTRVAPAVLDAGLADQQKSNQIIVLQPRRVAARAAAARISDERGTELGGEIGYQVRFESRHSKNTRILVCTEGILLRKLLEDPFLERASVVVFDEFHERSVDSDLALALVRQVKEVVRPDLRIVVMSATLDPGPIAEYLGGCPTVECPGQTFPVEIEYLRSPSSASVDEQTANGIVQLLSRCSGGHLLGFLPGVGEIRQTSERLAELDLPSDIDIMSLYGELPLEEQQRVLAPSQRRKIILATNVAETSITIDGIAGVVDSGLMRINRLDARLGLNRLEVDRISKASAEQRAGRAGRTSSGVALRLWGEREHQMLRDFEVPEIARVELSQTILALLAIGETDIRNFPWFEPPPPLVLERALHLLNLLDATSNGRLTELGTHMSRLPLHPRLARLMVEGKRLGEPKRTALCAALLSERDPFRRKPAGENKPEHQSNSDVLDRLDALESFSQKGLRHSLAGELLSGPAKQILRASDQLFKTMKDVDVSAAGQPGTKDGVACSSADEAVMRALLVAYPDRVCKRRDAKSRRALMVGGRGVRLADESAVESAELFVAVDLIDTGQSESLVRTASAVQRSWLPQTHISQTIETLFDTTRQKVMAMRRVRFSDLIIEESPAPLPPEVDVSALLAESVIARFDLSTLVDEAGQKYLARVQCLREWIPELELPDFGSEPLKELLQDWCTGCTSVDDLRSNSLVSAIQMRLTHQQISEIDREAPESLPLPSGKRAKLEYEFGKPPVLAVRIQELFGTRETPRIARSRVSVLLHLLAPNFRVQQITPDLAGFWKNTYSDVRKDLRSRYPKHAWPEDPTTASPPPNRGKPER
jgi:ATP-dependent helicase HrpB